MGNQGLHGRLGLAMRAGQLVCGGYAVEKLLRAGDTAVVLLDATASDNTRKKYADACAHHHVPLHMLEAGCLSQAIGRPGRMVAAAKIGPMGTALSNALARQDND